MTGGAKVTRSGAAAAAKAAEIAARKAAAIHKRPCISAPSVSGSVTLTFVKREVHHREEWLGRVKWAAVTTDVGSRPLTVEAYEVQLQATDASGVPVEVDGGDNDFWRQNIPADSGLRAVFHPLPKPKTYYYQARVRTLNRVHYGKCWSAWSSWTSAAIPSSGTLTGPPAPTGLAQTLSKDAPAGNPWRNRVVWNRSGTWTPTGGDALAGAAQYRIEMQVSASNGGTVMRTIHQTIVDPGTGTTAEHSFDGIRGKRWYRSRIAAVSQYGVIGAYSSYTAWASPRGDPDPPTGVAVDNPLPRVVRVTWTPPSDLTDVDRFKVRVYRTSLAGTLVETAYTGKGASHFTWHVPSAEFGAHPHATYAARVNSIEDPYSTDIDDTSTGTSSEAVSSNLDSSTIADTATIPFADVVHTDGLAPSSSPAVTAAAQKTVANVLLTWTAISNADAVTYDVYRHTSSPYTPPGTGTLLASLSGTSYLDTTGTPGITYYYRIIARDADGSAAPGTVGSAVAPVKSSDGSAPASSPTPTLTGGVGFILASWTAIANNDVVSYDVHVSTSSGFTPDGTTLYGSVDGTMVFIKHMPDGSALSYDSTYYVKLYARDVDGSASVGSEASAVMVPATSPDIATNAIIANKIAAQAVTADSLAATIVLATVFKTALTGNRIEFDTLGVRAYDSTGALVVNVPTDGSAVYVSGAIQANSLNVTGNFDFAGTANTFEQNSVSTLSSGVLTAPTNAPAVAMQWERHAGGSSPTGMTASLYDIAYIAAGGSGLSGGAMFYVGYLDASNYPNIAEYKVSDYSLNRTWRVNAVANNMYSFAVVGNDIFALVLVSGAWKALTFHITTASPTLVSTLAVTMPCTANTPKIGYDGTNVIIADVQASNSHVLWQKYTTGMVATGGLLLDATVSGLTALRGIYCGSADLGAARVILTEQGSSSAQYYARSFTASTPAEQANEKFGVGTSTGYGRDIVYDGTQFWTLDPASNAFTFCKHSTWTWTTASSTYYAAYSWAQTSGSKETAAGPYATVTMLRRAFMNVGGIPSIPSAANRVGYYLYVNNGDGSHTTPIAGVYWQQGGALQTTTSLVISTYASSGTHDGTGGAFSGGTAAKLTTGGGGFVLNGDDTGGWPLLAPVGSINMYAGYQSWSTSTGVVALPTGWLLCNGAKASRATYPALFAALVKQIGSATTDVAADTFTYTAHGLQAGDVIYLSALASTTGVSTNVAYYVISSGLTSSVFKISLTYNGAAINLTGSNGTATVQWAPYGLNGPNVMATDGTDFILPDLRSRFPVGAGTLLTGMGGIDGVTAEASRTPNHSHGLTGVVSHTHPAGSGGSVNVLEVNAGGSLTSPAAGTTRAFGALHTHTTPASGSATATDATSGQLYMPTIALAFIIKT